MKKLFISYRRSDSHDVVRDIAKALISEFGETNVFFDRTSALPGMTWPDSIRDAIEQADALLVVIGPKWLQTHDEMSGRRRIDIENDWVRLEIVNFLKRKKVHPELLVLPVLVNDAPMPRSEYFDEELKSLCDFQPVQLQNIDTTLDITQIKQTLIQNRFQTIIPPSVVTPRGGIPPQQLTKDEENAFLDEYKQWRIIEQEKSGTHGDILRQFYRLYEFTNYKIAWRFMTKIDEVGIRPYNHQPRWQNNYNRVEVWLCTSNIGHKPSKKDIRLAKIFEQVWEEFKAEM